jgi:methylenetetrahydrofolate reductase (NADPH)
MQVSELLGKKSPVIAMEFYPPRSENDTEKFGKTVDTLSAYKPDYMSMTFGAGGSTRDGSYQAVAMMLEKKQPTVAYLAGYGLSPDEIRQVLDRYQALGVETIFVIRGDKPKDDNFKPSPGSFSYASDIIAFVKKHYNFCLGCAGYPEGHIEAESLAKDIGFLKRKLDSGADYVVTQYFYDNRFYYDYVETCRREGMKVPIVPGIMPVYTIKMSQMLSRVCGSSITPALQEKFDQVDAADKDAVLQLGIDFSAEQCRDLLKHDVPGLHFYTMDRAHSTSRIIEMLKNEKLL